MAEAPANCGRCRYHHALRTAPDDPYQQRASGRRVDGECRRFPPQPDLHDFNVRLWPRVWPADWCGAFEAKRGGI